MVAIFSLRVRMILMQYMALTESSNVLKIFAVHPCSQPQVHCLTNALQSPSFPPPCQLHIHTQTQTPWHKPLKTLHILRMVLFLQSGKYVCLWKMKIQMTWSSYMSLMYSTAIVMIFNRCVPESSMISANASKLKLQPSDFSWPTYKATEYVLATWEHRKDV